MNSNKSAKDYLRPLKKQMQRARVIYQTRKEHLKTIGSKLETAEQQLLDIKEASCIIQSIAQKVQETAHIRVSQIVTTCLETIFDDPYTFHMHFERKRNKTETRIVLERDGVEVDPLTASGGGVVDVVAFALRLACLVLSSPAKRKLLVLDEPFRFVSSEYRERVRILLETLAADMKVQIIMVTHSNELQTGKIIEI